MSRLGYRWVEPGYTPPGYEPSADAQDSVGTAWKAMFTELTFVAESDEGDAIALWRYREDVAEDRAPIVVVDTEGQLTCTATSLANHVVRSQLQRDEDPEPIRAWLGTNGIPTLATLELLYASVRFLPDPGARLEALQDGDAGLLPITRTQPTEVLHLLGMLGDDPRVAAFLAGIENPSNPIHVACDRVGRVCTIALLPDSVIGVVSVRGISLGLPASALTRLGSPTMSKPTWRRWDDDTVAMHVELTDDRVSRITLMATATLPDHLA